MGRAKGVFMAILSRLMEQAHTIASLYPNGHDGVPTMADFLSVKALEVASANCVQEDQSVWRDVACMVDVAMSFDHDPSLFIHHHLGWAGVSRFVYQTHARQLAMLTRQVVQWKKSLYLMQSGDWQKFEAVYGQIDAREKACEHALAHGDRLMVMAMGCVALDLIPEIF